METIDGFLDIKLNKKRANDDDNNNKSKKANTSSSSLLLLKDKDLLKASKPSSSSSLPKEKSLSNEPKKTYKYNCIHGRRKYDCSDPACYTSKKSKT